jgi:hypothetical protein
LKAIKDKSGVGGSGPLPPPLPHSSLDNDISLANSKIALVKRQLQQRTSANKIYEIRMSINGIGYSVSLKKNAVVEQSSTFRVINRGNKKPLIVNTPKSIDLTVLNENELIGKSHDFLLLTQFFSSIRQIKASYKDKYKAKGFSKHSVTK